MIVWGLWFVHLFISSLFVAGVVAAYNRFWQLAFRGKPTDRRNYTRAARGILLVLPLLVALLLEFAAYADPINWALYTNIEWFVLLYPVLDEEINGWEYSFRVVLAGSFWLWQHDLSDVNIRSLGLVTILLFALVWPFREKVHYSWWLDTPVALFMAFVFWHAQARVTGVLEFGPIMTFMLVNQFAFVYWTRVHRQDLHKQELERRANFDALTNARSYSLFQRDVTAGFTRAQTADVPLTIVMLDIDHFKEVNDQYGHLAGNQVLIGVASLLDDMLQSVFGDENRLYRTGGEEFNLIFVGKSVADVMPVIKQAWRDVRNQNFEYEGQNIRVTISVGVTAMRADDQKVDDVYKRADDNLYRSKRAGRDTITVEGETLSFCEERLAGARYTYMLQPIVSATSGEVLSRELLLRVYDEQQSRWRLPDHFDISTSTQISLMRRVLDQTDVDALTLNLTTAQFADEEVAYQLLEFAMREPRLRQLTIDVPHLPEIAATRNVCAIYRSGGIAVAIDDVGDTNDLAAVLAVIDEVDELKMTLRLLASTYSPVQQQASVEAWRSLANEHGKMFTLEAIECDRQEQLARRAGVSRLQGFRFGKPEFAQNK